MRGAEGELRGYQNILYGASKEVYMERNWKATALGFATYAAVVTVITLFNNDFMITEFCGSLGDFTQGPVAQVCLSFGEYWVRAATHVPYIILSGAVSLTVALGYQVNVLRIAREKFE